MIKCLSLFQAFVPRFIPVKVLTLLLVAFLVIACKQGRAINYVSIATGSWSNSTTWSPSGVPGSGDNVTIHGGNTVTIDGTDSCINLTLGDATATNTTLTITTAGNSLNI